MTNAIPAADLAANTAEMRSASEAANVPVSDFTPEQLQTMAAELVKGGKLSQQEADAALKVDGVEPAQQAAPLSPEAQEMDHAFPPAKPTEYDFTALYNGDDVSKETLAFDQQARGWLSEARFTKEIGSSLAREVDRVTVKHASMSEAEREIYKRTEFNKLERVWGSDTPKKIGAARRLVLELEAKSPGIVDVLERTGAGNSAIVIAQIAMQAERLLARKGG